VSSAAKPPVAPVSVVVPAHDRAHVIARSVASAWAQQPRPAEVIVVDDHSSDDTADRAERAGARVLRHDRNQGPGPARNTGMRAAAQPWVAFLDSDDEWLPGHLARAFAAVDGQVLVSAPGLVPLSHGGRARLVGNASGRPVRLDRPLTFLEPENLVATSGTVVATDVALAVGGFPAGRMSEDLDLWVRVLERGTGLALAEPGYVYHQLAVRASSDVVGMRTAAAAYLQAYGDRPWFDAAVLERMRTRGAWDDRPRSAAIGARRAIADLGWLVRHPVAGPAVAGLLLHRRRARAAGTRAAARLLGPRVADARDQVN
jgi:glycosyltransferase involved in cell wall biosynthesis